MTPASRSRRISHRRRRLTNHSERRRRIRFRATLPIRIHAQDTDLRGETRNVSLLGASAITDRPAPEGVPVTAEMDLPGGGGPPIRMEGTIVRSVSLNLPGDARYEVGVFAMRFHDQDELRLSQYLDQIQMAEYAAVRAGYKALREKIRQRQAKRRALLARRRRLARRAKRTGRPRTHHSTRRPSRGCGQRRPHHGPLTC